MVLLTAPKPTMQATSARALRATSIAALAPAAAASACQATAPRTDRAVGHASMPVCAALSVAEIALPTAGRGEWGPAGGALSQPGWRRLVFGAASALQFRFSNGACSHPHSFLAGGPLVPGSRCNSTLRCPAAKQHCLAALGYPSSFIRPPLFGPQVAF